MGQEVGMKSGTAGRNEKWDRRQECKAEQEVGSKSGTGVRNENWDRR